MESNKPRIINDHVRTNSSSSSESPPCTIRPPRRLRRCVHSSTSGNISEGSASRSEGGKGIGEMAKLSLNFEEKPRPSRSSTLSCTAKSRKKPLPKGVHRLELFGHFTKVSIEGQVLWRGCDECGAEKKAGTSKDSSNDNDDNQK